MLSRVKLLQNSLTKISQDRLKQHIPPPCLSIDHVKELCNILENNFNNDKYNDFLLYNFLNNITPGVDETSYIKANLLNKICKEEIKVDLINKQGAVKILGTMQGGYNINILVDLLDDPQLGNLALKELKKSILIFDSYHDVVEKYKNKNSYAEDLLHSWANADWFIKKAPLKREIHLTVFKVPGEINTDDLSPAQDAWSRPDIPLHSLSMFKNPRENINPDIPYEMGPMSQIMDLKKSNKQIVFVGDVIGTGSSRKSATNSLLWHFGKQLPYVPGKKSGGFCFGNKIAPIFFNTMEDSGALPIEMDVSKINNGDSIILFPYENKVTNINYKLLARWEYKTPNILDSVRAGGRINLIIGKSLTNKAIETLSNKTTFFKSKEIFTPTQVTQTIPNQKYTLAQKIVGKACNQIGVLPGTYCEPKVTSVGSQDTTGPMTRDELKDLACLGFSSDLVMQSFCHTAAYPKPVDIITHNTLPEFINNRGGISLKPGDGIIHSWLNRMLLPDTVGTGGDSHTRFPIGISFPAGSGLVAFASATGIMPLDMPESVLVKFHGEMQPGITLRDLVHSIPYFAKKKGLLTIEKKNKVNIFNGNILEIEGLPNLTCEQAFELSDASAERSASGCTIKLNKEPIIEYLNSNIALLEWMIKENYQDARTIQRRINKMKEWLDNPILIEADDGASYKEILNINLNEITEPILCAPNDPDDAVLLSEVCDEKISEVFIGSCMTNIGHFRASGELLKDNNNPLKSKLWIAPPTKMDENKLKEEGYYEIFEKSGVQLEMPGCSLCMGNQARVEDNATVLSTSTRNFPNRLGKGANVYLASAELSVITSLLGKIPNKETYLSYFKKINKDKDKIFNYLNFDKLSEYKK